MIYYQILHNILHLILPLTVLRYFPETSRLKAWIIMISVYVIDIDHIFADPIFDPARCSIGFHPLHSFYAISVYILMLFSKKTRLISAGLLIHIFTDFTDCVRIYFTS